MPRSGTGPVRCSTRPYTARNLYARNSMQGGIVMRNNRRWFRISLTLLALPLLFALFAGARVDDHKETKYRWDIIKVTSFNPLTVFERGFLSTLATDCSTIPLPSNRT